MDGTIEPRRLLQLLFPGFDGRTRRQYYGLAARPQLIYPIPHPFRRIESGVDQDRTRRRVSRRCGASQHW